MHISYTYSVLIIPIPPPVIGFISTLFARWRERVIVESRKRLMSSKARMLGYRGSEHIFRVWSHFGRNRDGRISPYRIKKRLLISP